MGTLYKEMPLKPQYLKGVESILGARKIESFVNELEDFLVIEDETGRIRISNSNIPPKFNPSNFITGICCAILGKLDEKGLFHPLDIEYIEIDYNPRGISENIQYNSVYIFFI